MEFLLDIIRLKVYSQPFKYRIGIEVLQFFSEGKKAYNVQMYFVASELARLPCCGKLLSFPQITRMQSVFDSNDLHVHCKWQDVI